MRNRHALLRRSTTRLGVGLMLAASLLAAACGSDDDDASGDTTATSAGTNAPTTTEGATTSSAPQTTAAPTTTEPDVAYVDDAEVQFAGAVVGQDFDPHKAGGTLAGIIDVFDPLIRPMADFTLSPGLATEWEFTDDTTLQLTLREGVTFHDGTPFNADAVVASLDRARGSETSQHKAALASIAEVVKVDDFTVDLKLSQPDATIVNVLSTPASYIINPKLINDANAIATGARGVGTGPYILTSYTPTTVVVIERNDDYWDPAVIEHAPKTFQFDYVLDGNARFNGLQTGAYDGIQWVGTPGLSGDNGLIATDDNFAENNASAMTVFGVGFNLAAPPFDDENVRKAIAHALDIPSINADLLGDEMGCAAEQPAQLPVKGQFGHDDSLEPIGYDVEEAKRLLAEAGYPDGEGFPAITFAASVGSNDLVAAQAFVEMLKEIGIDDVTINEQPSRVFVLAELQAGKAQMVTMNIGQGAGIDPAPAHDIGILAVPLVDDSPGGQEYKALLTQAKAELDADARADLYSQVAQLAIDHAFYVPFCSNKTGFATTSNIVGITDSFWLKFGVPQASAIRVTAD